ncbi:MAG: hypothetical protein VYD54_10720 [Bdellovibrionota bacterium]|nr:hypothetical protein [Bdellovibrionota bacterium]
MNTIFSFGRSWFFTVLGLVLSLSCSFYSSASVIEEKDLLFSENMSSMDQGNIHISASLMEKSKLLGSYPEIQDMDQNSLFDDSGVKFLFSKLQFIVKKDLTSFSKDKIHNPGGFERLSENVTVKKSSMISDHQIDIVAHKKVSLVSFTSEASFYYFNENEYQDQVYVMNALESLLEGRKPDIATLISTVTFSKFFNKAVNYCFYEGLKEKEVLITCFSVLSVKKGALRKYGWITDFRKSFKGELLYTARQIMRL